MLANAREVSRVPTRHAALPPLSHGCCRISCRSRAQRDAGTISNVQRSRPHMVGRYMGNVSSLRLFQPGVRLARFNISATIGGLSKSWRFMVRSFFCVRFRGVRTLKLLLTVYLCRTPRFGGYGHTPQVGGYG